MQAHGCITLCMADEMCYAHERLHVLAPCYDFGDSRHMLGARLMPVTGPPFSYILHVHRLQKVSTRHRLSSIFAFAGGGYGHHRRYKLEG